MAVSWTNGFLRGMTCEQEKYTLLYGLIGLLFTLDPQQPSRAEVDVPN